MGRNRLTAAQVEVLELQSIMRENYKLALGIMLPACTGVHTLLLSGVWGLDLRILKCMPRLECLSLTYCFSECLADLSELASLRWGAMAHMCFCCGEVHGRCIGRVNVPMLGSMHAHGLCQ